MKPTKVDMLSPTEMGLESSPTQEGRDRCPLDRLIRAKGYSIYSRPLGGDPVWTKGCVQFTQRDVLLREGLE